MDSQDARSAAQGQDDVCEKHGLTFTEHKCLVPRPEVRAACVCGEINTRHCPVHGQGDTTASTGRELLERAAVKVCAYVWTDEKAPSCLDEWPNQPETWCGACLGKEALRLGIRTGRIVHGDA